MSKPVWTTVTDDPASRPADGAVVLVRRDDGCVMFSHASEGWPPRGAAWMPPPSPTAELLSDEDRVRLEAMRALEEAADEATINGCAVVIDQIDDDEWQVSGWDGVATMVKLGSGPTLASALLAAAGGAEG